MLSISKMGFLFDVDGTLTTFRKNDSLIDLLVVRDLDRIRKMGYPIGLVTGRSIDWVRNTFFEHIDSSLRDYIYIAGEFGLVNYYQGKKRKRRLSKETKTLLVKVKDEMIKTICDYRELEPCISYEQPDYRCLWIEPKEIMVTLRTLPLFGLTVDKYVRLVEPIIAKHSDQLKIIPNKYALDILPININKKQAAEKVINKLDPEREVNHWFALGDTEADSEMGKVTSRKVDFFQVKQGVTSETHYFIEKALAGKFSKQEQ